MKLSLYLPGRTPAIVVPADRGIAFRSNGHEIEVVVGGQVIASRSHRFEPTIELVGDEQTTDARVQSVLDEEDARLGRSAPASAAASGESAPVDGEPAQGAGA
jgi:hypothetical protein